MPHPGSTAIPALALLLATAVTSPAVVLAQAAKPAAPAAPVLSFEEVARRAKEARETNRAEEAIALYKKGVRLRPRWDEGWWYLGTLLYEKDRFEAARDAFRRMLAVKADVGAAWALRGLCDFRVADYPAALEHITKGLQLGLGDNRELTSVVRYHQGLLQVKGGQFELALESLTLLARTGQETPGLTDAIGLMLLRKALVPSEIPEADRDLVRQAGHAGYLSLARQGDAAALAFAALVAAYPSTPYVHYAAGAFLLQSDADRGLAELRREVQIFPDNVFAHLEIAFELLRRADHEGAKAAAEQAVRIAPGLFAAHNALGRALVDAGDLERGLKELEEAVRLAPEAPEMYFSLARAYQKAGRTEDAARARAQFAEMDKKRRELRGQAPQGRDQANPPL